MANKKRNKYPSKSKVLADARRYVIKTGEYNGASSSSDFYVTGHSTGATNTEMDELSRQVTRDAGGYDYQEPEFANDQGETAYEMYQGEGIGDVGGPELYGNRYAPPSRTSRGLAIGAAVGLAATALLGGLAYIYYKAEAKPVRRRVQAKANSKATAKKSASAGVVASASTSASAKKKRGAKRSSQPRA